MNTKTLRRMTFALILLSMLFIFSACEGKTDLTVDPIACFTDQVVTEVPAVEPDVTVEPEPTDRPGSSPFLTIYTLDRGTGERDEPDVYRHLVYATSGDLNADGMPLIYELSEVKDKLPVISLSACEIGYDLPTECSASVKNVEVLSTLPSGETVRVRFGALDEALAYAKAHFEDEDASHVIDVLLKYTDRYVEQRGYESGEEGYAFRVEP